jgi:hypothetical protein
MMYERPLDRSPYYVDHFEHLDRVLNRPQLTGKYDTCLFYLQRPLLIEWLNRNRNLGMYRRRCTRHIRLLDHHCRLTWRAFELCPRWHHIGMRAIHSHGDGIESSIDGSFDRSAPSLP